MICSKEMIFPCKEFHLFVNVFQFNLLYVPVQPSVPFCNKKIYSMMALGKRVSEIKLQGSLIN